MKYLGSKTIETDRLVLKAQTMEEQKYLWSVLMIPDVNRYYLTVPKKYAEKLIDWNKQEEYYKEDMKHANDLDVFRWSVFLKDTGECIGRVSCHEAKSEGYEIDNPSIRGVGWYIDPKYKGHGYGNEAAQAMMDYMFNECEIEEIKTGAAIQNPASSQSHQFLLVHKVFCARRIQQNQLFPDQHLNLQAQQSAPYQ